ncbi:MULTISPECIES: hypothetical protein [Enterococcus]|uniref:hypothetical protein n=1 Tax=Enterococcus TaxID=1350 RepID=UPI002100D152|nr:MULTISPECIES: hypothetical protein [Enterococcus]MDT2804917.1 hypothetical protein [Enterococcus lactis]UTU59991.1 hypothetical protein NEH82_00105 [Enterococcus faecium]
MEVFAQEFLPILEQSEVDLNKFVIPEKSKRVIGLGLAPGVTNLAAAAYTKKEPSAQMIVIDVLLGIGDRHGEGSSSKMDL